jgi:hypothetical protein
MSPYYIIKEKNPIEFVSRWVLKLQLGIMFPLKSDGHMRVRSRPTIKKYHEKSKL